MLRSCKIIIHAEEHKILFNTIWSGLIDVRYGPGHAPPPPLISKSTNSIGMTIYSTLYQNCSRYISGICVIIRLGLAKIIRCLCIKVVFCKCLVTVQ